MISLLVVNYRSAELTAAAIRSARSTTSRPLHVVVVDNSCDDAEAARLRDVADVLVVSTSNRGYAGAINDGRKRCEGDVIVVSNPDVLFGAGAIDRLTDALDRKTVVAGPALFWDSAEAWLLPPSDLHTGYEVIDRALASRSAEWRRVRDARRIRRRIAFWRLSSTTRVKAISGAVMAIRAEAFDAVEGFDERFPLYFEENDFLRRVSAIRRHIAYVPAARCRHLYNQSASQVQAHAQSAYAQSEERYLAKWNGPLAARVLKRIERPMPPLPAVPLSGPIPASPGSLIEVSPLPSFDTAAGHFASGASVDVPDEIWDSFRASSLYFRVVDVKTAAAAATYVRYKS